MDSSYRIRKEVSMSYKLYDAEIEYLESDGWAYIDTNYVPNSNTSVNVRYMPVSDSVVMTTPYCPIGGNVAYTDHNFSLWAPVNRNTAIFTLLGNTSTTIELTSSILDIVHTCTFSQNSNTMIFDGTSYNVNGSGDFTYTIPLRLFKPNTNNNTPSTQGHKVRIYSLNISENGVKIHDFIPVRVGNVGYMYDKVTGQLFGNSGTGSFVLGSDVAPERYANEVAFLESWGNQYIDTGIKPSTDTKIELKCLYCKSGAGLTNYGALIGADDASNAYILNHSAVANFTYGLEFSNNFANPQTRLLTFDSTASPQSMRVYDEGGSLVTTLTCIRGVFEVNQNLYLFAVNRGGTPVYGSNRIMYCKIYNGDTLVRDYVPVEYNGIGYMYDKVSGLFFDNQGTGKFLFGSIAKACARSYTRRQLMADTVLPKPYISDGLVFHLDGADATDTTWVDRIGGNTFTNDGSATHDGKSVRGSYSSPTAIGVRRNVGTIEVCGEIVSSWGSADNNAFLVRDKDHIYGLNYILRPRETSPYAHISSRNTIQAPRSYRSVGIGKFTHSLNIERHVFNGTLGTLGGNTYNTTNASSSFVGHYKVRIYQVRIYNRLLTEAEMKYNQEQDRKKYGIQF